MQGTLWSGGSKDLIVEREDAKSHLFITINSDLDLSDSAVSVSLLGLPEIKIPPASPKPKEEWVLETSQHQWTFYTPDYDYPGGWPENTHETEPLDENHQLRNPHYTFDDIGGAAWSNFSDHRPPVFSPNLEITQGGRSLKITYKSWSHPFPVHLWADVWRRNQ
jgi:hypothetical protein